MNNIPTLDIRRFDSERELFVTELGAACRQFGFCCISAHGISRELIHGAYAVFKRLFDLPVETKMKYHLPGGDGQRGYTPARAQSVDDRQYAGLAQHSESWRLGREVDPASALAVSIPLNIWADEVAELKQYGYGLYDAFDRLAARLLHGLALDAGLPERHFADLTRVGDSTLRAIHFPPLPTSNLADVLFSSHKDSHFATLLPGSDAEGLEVLTHDGNWLPVTPQDDAIVFNVGDMLQHASHHTFASATHRAVIASRENTRRPRYLLPFSLYPSSPTV
ncbi:MAG: isopenicillin N synthase family oxygenase [Pseudomonadota bacterium]|jgi:isopenicillin N synthase-like dioxygenase|uniref:isopenicillin N synthase family dioxygenase n=2 Tax=Burkholderiales TaxID=80840 RepID=UPI001BB1174F|nr:isopenicillin N synthase family oxygenase [Burkholderia sp. 4M9327F10]